MNTHETSVTKRVAEYYRAADALREAASAAPALVVCNYGSDAGLQKVIDDFDQPIITNPKDDLQMIQATAPAPATVESLTAALENAKAAEAQARKAARQAEQERKAKERAEDEKQALLVAVRDARAQATAQVGLLGMIACAITDGDDFLESFLPADTAKHADWLDDVAKANGFKLVRVGKRVALAKA